jgi:hypothetical protein
VLTREIIQGLLASQFIVITILRFSQAKILGLFSMAKRQNFSMHPCMLSRSALFFVKIRLRENEYITFVYGK